MNRLNGIISHIQHNGTLSLVDVDVNHTHFTAILLETPASATYLRIGESVTLLFKETEVSLAKNLQGELSLRNRFSVKVTHIDDGDILTAVTMDFMGNKIVSVITTRGVNRLKIVVGDELEALIKANEVVIMEGHHAN